MEGYNMNDDLYPLALLMDELKHDDVANRVEAMQKLDTIAIALGPERTRQELMPFLHEVAQDDEEEVFAVLASKLGEFIPYVGGHQHCQQIISILSVLASLEEPIVRDKAIDSLNKISLELTHDEINGIFLQLIETLSTGTWFSSKVAACGLYKSVIIKVNGATRKKLLSLYLKLVTDDSPIVRRSAASHLPTLIDKLTEFTKTNKVTSDEVTNQDWEIISQMFQFLINDDQDSVKHLSVEVLVLILEFFQSVNDQSHNLEFLISSLKLINDESWRVRYAAADKFAKVSKNFISNELELLKLVDPFILLMKDNEGEVRKAIAKQLPDFCLLLHNTNKTNSNDIILNKIIPVVDELSQDPHENVRASLASTITGLAPILQKDATIDNLLPIFLMMLKDEYPDVRLNIISNLSVVNDTIGINLLSTSLLPAITELAQDNKWRVRLAIIEYIPKLADQLGVSFFNDELLSLCMSWLWDPVFAIRDAAVTNLKELTTIFGSSWAEREIVDRLLNNKFETIDDEKIDYSNFIIRITCLFAITKLVPVIDYEVIVNKLLPFIDNLVTDAVPNIRFNIAKSFLVIVQRFNEINDAKKAVTKDEFTKLIKNDIIPNLEKLLNDNDDDVRFFASKSIQEISVLF